MDTPTNKASDAAPAPSTSTPDTASEYSTKPLVAPKPEVTKNGFKNMWKKLKEEDAQRKQKQIVHVTPEEAAKITGYDKNGQVGGDDGRGTGVGKLIAFFI